MKQNNTKPPINVGEEYTGMVESVGEKGDGVLRVKGFVVFVPNVEKGDYVKIRIEKVLPKVSFAKLIEKVEPPATKKKREEEKKKKEIAHLLTTDGDSEDFGGDDEEEDF